MTPISMPTSRSKAAPGKLLKQCDFRRPDYSNLVQLCRQILSGWIWILEWVYWLSHNELAGAIDNQHAAQEVVVESFDRAHPAAKCYLQGRAGCLDRVIAVTTRNAGCPATLNLNVQLVSARG